MLDVLSQSSPVEEDTAEGWLSLDEEKHYHGQIPPGLDEMEPGPALAAFLSIIDVGTVSGDDRIAVLRAHQRMLSHYQAAVYEDMGSLMAVFDADGDYGLAAQCAAAEIRAALRLTRTAADIELDTALALCERLPRVREALSAGVIDSRRARVLIHETSHLPADLAQRVVDSVMPAASGLTTGQLAAKIRRAIIEVDPDAAKERFEEAIEERRVVADLSREGTARLAGFGLSPQGVAEAMSRIDAIARSLKVGDEARTMDQLRADVFLDLLTGATEDKSKGLVEIRVDLATLAELDDQPGELAGYGPVIADIARQVAESHRRSTWTVTVQDGDRIVHTATTRRRPTASQRRDVLARNPTCVFPGCRMPASRSDLDHNHPWAEFHRTETDDLAPLCRHDHGLRHQGWEIEHLGDGTYRWTSMLGQCYITKPP